MDKLLYNFQETQNNEFDNLEFTLKLEEVSTEKLCGGSSSGAHGCSASHAG